MNRLIGTFLLAGIVMPAAAQRLLSLDSCRALALRNNKQLSVSRVKQEMAKNVRKSARTKYLPHISAIGAYEFTSREISILSDEQKDALSNIGTTAKNQLGSDISSSAGNVQQVLNTGMQTLSTQLVGAGVPVGTVQTVMQGAGGLFNTLGTTMGQQLSGVADRATGYLNAMGQGVVEAFHTDTRHMFGGAILLTQPVFMGGGIVALNRMADIGERMAQNTADAKQQSTLYQIDQAYWTVVSLNHKKKLAEGYRDLVAKLDGDVQKMIREGVATRSEGLSVSVKVNEAEMNVTQVNDGLVLAKMYLCQLCGLPMDETIVLADENADELVITSSDTEKKVDMALANRPELQLLQNAIDLSRQSTRLLKAGNLPQVLLTGGYAVSNPSLYNGFQRRLGGVWNVGVMVRVPIWNWGDVMYKVRASKNATTIASLELDEAREKIELQVNQSSFKVAEANKKLAMTRKNIERAEENLRMANLGFREGVISSTTVMEAQTAWLQAQSQKIDAEIDVRLSEVHLQKALGTLSAGN